MFDLLPWILFFIFVLVMLFVDLYVFHRDTHIIQYKEALKWTFAWIALSLLFCLGIYFFLGSEPALNFLTGYLIEKSLSIDNLFVFLLIFNSFSVPDKYLHKVLFWGVIGALIMRAVFIFAGIALLQWFHWMIYIFGILLIVSGIKLAFTGQKNLDPRHNPVLKLFRKFYPVVNEYHNGYFFILEKGVRYATPLFIALLAVETTDLIFAIDSVPAILAITTDPFIVYTSNIFAILGLRSLYFALSHFMSLFHYLHYGLSALLVFVGIKMIIADVYPIPIPLALLVILSILTLSMLASVFFPAKEL